MSTAKNEISPKAARLAWSPRFKARMAGIIITNARCGGNDGLTFL
jgi:hypothetical protein